MASTCRSCSRSSPHNRTARPSRSSRCPLRRAARAVIRAGRGRAAPIENQESRIRRTLGKGRRLIVRGVREFVVLDSWFFIVPSSPSLSAFRHRNYRLFFGGQLISLTGTWMQSVAESWLVFRLTGSSALLGVSSFASLVPVFLLAPLGGTIADRTNRHRIIVTTQ